MDQAEQLRRKLQHFYESQAKTVAVISGKGGVGKSNFVLNLSLNLAKRNKKVLLIDSDIGMANIELLLGQPSSTYSIVDIFEKQMPFEQVIQNGPYGLSYLSGGNTLSKIVQLEDEGFQYFLKQLEKMVTSFEYILFDLGAGISENSMRFLLAVDEIIVVTTPEPTAVMDAYASIKLVHQYDPHKRIKIVINRCQKQNDGNLTFERLNATTNRFLSHELQLLGYLPDDYHLQQAVMNQKPIVIQYPNSPIAKALEKITNDYLGEKSHQKGFFQRFKKLFLKG